MSSSRQSVAARSKSDAGGRFPTRWYLRPPPRARQRHRAVTRALGRLSAERHGTRKQHASPPAAQLLTQLRRALLAHLRRLLLARFRRMQGGARDPWNLKPSTWITARSGYLREGRGVSD